MASEKSLKKPVSQKPLGEGARIVTNRRFSIDTILIFASHYKQKELQ